MSTPAALGSEKSRELLDGEGCLAKDRAERSGGELTMERNDRCSSFVVTELHMASPLADLLEAGLAERPHCLCAGDDRQTRIHAAMSIDAMIGGSAACGTGLSSK